MPIKKLELEGMNPVSPLNQVIEELNDNLDAIVSAIDSVGGGSGVVGPQGLKGDKGDTGAIGPQGETGPAGVDGAQGPQGIQGIQGEKGETGAQGLPGKDGAQGIQGPKGDTGAQGIQGIQGPKGDTGAQGIQGLKGDKGDTGLTGPASTNLLNQKIILNNVPAATRYDSVDVPSWNTSYTSQGGQVLVRADITAWTGSVASRNWYLKKNGTTVATGTFFFNAPNTHTTMPSLQYVDTSTGTNAWSISLGSGLIVDTNDYATITVSETVVTTPVAPTSTTTTSTTTSGGPPIVGSAPNPFAPIVVTSLQGYKAGCVDDGVELTLDTVAVRMNTASPRSLQFRVTTGTMNVNISGIIYWTNNGTGNLGATYWQTKVLNTTYQQPFGWDFPWANDNAVYNLQDLTNKRYYRITLSIGPGYKGNFIVMERLV